MVVTEAKVEMLCDQLDEIGANPEEVTTAVAAEYAAWPRAHQSPRFRARRRATAVASHTDITDLRQIQALADIARSSSAGSWVNNAGGFVFEPGRD